jgi:lipopolysaccharide transport system permease protein
MSNVKEISLLDESIAADGEVTADPSSRSTAIAPLRKQRLVIEARSTWAPLDLRECWRYRDLLWIMSLREIQVRYKQTVLGVLWAVIQPLLTTGIFAVLLGLLMGKGNEPGARGVPYVVSTFCAMLPWQLFANSLSQAGNSLVSNQRLVTKVYFPRLIIPLSAVFGAFADFAVAFVAFLGVMLCYGVIPGWPILALPLFVLVALIASLAVGLWLSALTAVYRDFRYVVPFVLQVGLFVSPVIYTTEKIAAKLPKWGTMLYGLNPMVGVIEGFRWALVGAAPPSGLVLIPSLAMTISLLVAGAYYFRHMERTFADVI